MKPVASSIKQKLEEKKVKRLTLSKPASSNRYILAAVTDKGNMYTFFDNLFSDDDGK